MKTTKCLFCDKETSNPRFCSKSCAAKFNNTRRKPRTEESKRKVQENLKAYYKSDEGVKKKKSQVKTSVETRKNIGMYIL